jgi:hypothetical protein
MIPPFVENDNLIKPLPDKTYNEQINIQDIPSSEQINPQQNNFNAPRPVY